MFFKCRFVEYFTAFLTSEGNISPLCVEKFHRHITPQLSCFWDDPFFQTLSLFVVSGLWLMLWLIITEEVCSMLLTCLWGWFCCDCQTFWLRIIRC